MIIRRRRSSYCGALEIRHESVKKLTHIDARGRARMVDVAAKGETRRTARAGGRIRMLPSTLRKIASGGAAKGDVLGVARTAAIQAAKRTSELIPLCHPLALTHVGVDFTIDRKAGAVECVATVSTIGRTGVEMEALTAVAVGLLTVYDMCKAADRGMRMERIRLLEKLGGKSGHWLAGRPARR
jgi:cyclic pyranopterin phosphate synthase